MQSRTRGADPRRPAEKSRIRTRHRGPFVQLLTDLVDAQRIGGRFAVGLEVPRRALCRMLRVRQSLLRADAGKTNVTRILADHYFWELGRFSVTYHALFGKTPSETLRRPAEPRRGGVPARFCCFGADRESLGMQ
jgi:hypothetical protein